MVKITKTTKPIKEKDIERSWHLVDVSDQSLGRIAGKISRLLQGKHKVNYAPYLDSGDFVVVVNAQRIKITGHKGENKIYTRYSGYPGGLKKISLNNLLKQKPAEVIKRAVLGMLPKNKLRKRRAARLFIFPDEKHPYEDKFKTLNSKFQSKVKLNYL